MVLRITEEQMRAFGSNDADFADWFVNDYMRTEMPEYLDIRAGNLKKMVLNGRRYAEGFGLDDVEAQVHFVTLMFKVGPDFFRFDGFAEILSQTERPPLERIEAIYNDVTSQQAEEALRKSDSRYWYPELVDFKDE